MFGSLIYDLLFFAIPVIMIIVSAVTVRFFLKAKKINETNPGTFSDKEIKKLKMIMLFTCIITGIFVVMVLCLCALMYVAVAYM